MLNKQNITKSCNKSDCGCKSDKDQFAKNIEIESSKEKDAEEKPTQDPTKFGDWQVNGRAIDF